MLQLALLFVLVSGYVC